jgi:hypothetical protein
MHFNRHALGICLAAAMLAGCAPLPFDSAQGDTLPLSSFPGSSNLARADIAPGYMKVSFEVAAPLQFSKYQYAVIFNTTGSGKTPESNSWAGYSFALQTNRQSGEPSAEAVAFVRSRNPHVPPAQFVIGTTPRQFTFTAYSNGAKTQFTILFQRSIFDAFERREKSSAWLFNAFSNSKNGFVDSMGSCGSCFVSPKLSVDQAFDKTIMASKKPKGIEPSAKIVSVEFANNP